MQLVIVAVGVAILLILMMVFKLNGFISLLLVSLFVGLSDGMSLAKVTSSMYKGIGSQLQSLVLILAFGAMLGKLMSDCGAAQKIAMTLIRKFGKARTQWAMLLTGLILGITMFFEAGFIILMPLVYTIFAAADLPLLYVALPAIVALTVDHCFLPPHPGPTAIVTMYHASVGLTMLEGLIIAIPVAIIVGIFFTNSKFARKVKASMPEGLVTQKPFREEELPSFGLSITIAVIPIVLIAVGTMVPMALPKKSPALAFFNFFGDAAMSLMITTLITIYMLGIRRGKKMKELMKSAAEGVKAIGMILLIIGAGGAFKQVIVDAGTANYIKTLVSDLYVSPLVMAWLIAAILRVSVGSATVAITMAGSIVLPLVTAGGVSPELMALATACGSAMASHVNDPGFWMTKEYLNLDIRGALKIKTVYTSLVSVLGLAGVMILGIFIK